MTQSYTVDMSDPRVRAMLGHDSPAPRGGVVQLAGDAPDPTRLTSNVGMMSTHHLNAGKHEVVVAYRDLFMTLDVYALPGEPVRVHLICPRCRKASSISGDRKAIDFDPGATNPIARRLQDTGTAEIAAAARGRISIEPFECTWELGGDTHAHGAVHTGASMCRMRLAIDDNIAKDA